MYFIGDSQDKQEEHFGALILSQIIILYTDFENSPSEIK